MGYELGWNWSKKINLTSSCINKSDNRQANILLTIFSIIHQVTYRVKSLRVYGLVGKKSNIEGTIETIRADNRKLITFVPSPLPNV